MTWDDLLTLCVKRFPLSTARREIANGLRRVLDRIEAAGVPCEVWLDGSFLTEKLNPEDVDLVVYFDWEVYESGTDEQRKALDWLTGNLKESYHCDSYVLASYPAHHPLASTGEWMRAYWIRQFGFSRGNHLKGLAVIKVGMP